MKFNTKDLGAALKRARVENNFTQERLAELVNITPVHIKQLEAGSRKPSIDVLYRLVKTLNMSVDNIFFPEGSDGCELRHKIERHLNDCSEYELKVIYATIAALRQVDSQ